MFSHWVHSFSVHMSVGDQVTFSYRPDLHVPSHKSPEATNIDRMSEAEAVKFQGLPAAVKPHGLPAPVNVPTLRVVPKRFTPFEMEDGWQSAKSSKGRSSNSGAKVVTAVKSVLVTDVAREGGELDIWKQIFAIQSMLAKGNADLERLMASAELKKLLGAMQRQGVPSEAPIASLGGPARAF